MIQQKVPAFDFHHDQITMAIDTNKFHAGRAIA